MSPTHRILNSEILPVALQMPDGSYLPSADQALGLWDKVRVILLDSTLDPRHTQIWGLFVFHDGKPIKYLAISDDYESLRAIQEDLAAISPHADRAVET